MLRPLVLVIFIISIGCVLSSFPAYASNHTFSVYGTVQDDDGTPIPGTTIRLLEPVNNSFNSEDPGIQTTVTDSKGNFQFINVTSESDTCAITIWYPDHKQYFPSGNSFRPFEASGVQYVNVTRIRIESDAPPTPSSATDAFFVLAVLGLVGLLKKQAQ